MTQSFSSDWSAALRSLYGSVVKEERLVDFLDQAMELIDARFLVLGMFDPHDPARHAHRFSAPRVIGPEGAMAFLGLAAQTHADGSDSMLDADPQKVLLDIDIYDDRAALDARATMKHLRETYGARHIGAVNAQANKAWVDYLMFAHDAAAFDDPEAVRESVAFFVPHIGVASEIRRAFALLEQRYQAIFSALNFLRYGVALVLDNDEVLLANESFETVLEARDGFTRAAGGGLVAADERSDALLQETLRSACAAAAGRCTNERRTIAIARRSSAPPYIVDVAPFCDDISGELNLTVNGALLFLVDPEQSATLSHKGLSAAFGFTAAEDGVCRQMLDGRTNAEIAETNNVALATVKSQVSSILGKTRVTDRAGLMRLASKVTPPLKDPDPQ